MWNKIKDLFSNNVQNTEEPKEEKTPPKPKRSKASKPVSIPQMSEKEIATLNGEPFIAVLNVAIDDPTNPRYGSFELDWNIHFIKMLRNNGYSGYNDEMIIDQWFQDVCRNVAMATIEEGYADNVRFINRKIGKDGKTEVS